MAEDTDLEYRSCKSAWRFYALSAKIRVVGELIGKHLFNALLAQNPILREWTNTVIEQSSDDLCIISWTCEAACTGAIVDGGDLSGCANNGSFVTVVSCSDLSTAMTRSLLVHMC